MRITADKLAELERKFSGGFEFVTPPTASVNDPVPAPKSVFDGHRFQPRGTCKNRAHDYGKRYEAALSRYDSQAAITIVEMGVLRGVGLAIWCELFPNALVIGLDVDRNHYLANYPKLLARGAFQRNSPEVYAFDELSPTGTEDLQNLIGPGNRIDIFIDDALHYTDAIVHAFGNLSPLVHDDGVYIIEDNSRAAAAINLAYPHANAVQQEELTVIDFAKSE